MVYESYIVMIKYYFVLIDRLLYQTIINNNLNKNMGTSSLYL